MIPEERRKQILELVEHMGYLSVDELARRLYISAPTVRRDLSILDREGIIRRTHGGASFITAGTYAWPFDLRRKVNLEEKSRIGHTAAQLVQDGDHLFIASGSTTYCLSKALDRTQKLTVMTNCIPIGQIVAEQPRKTVELPCGFYDTHDACVYGDEVTSSISRRWAKWFFASVGSFSVAKGFTELNNRGIAIKRAFHQHAQKTVLLMDHGKLSQPGFYQVFSWDEVDILITGELLGEAEQECCTKHHVQVIYSLCK